MKANILASLSNWKKLQANEHTIMAVLGVVVGLAGGYGAVGMTNGLGSIRQHRSGGRMGKSATKLDVRL